ncbi:MAG TPA: glycosyltransferase family 1 protein [Clostridiales bacterium]|nr:glycosyltransferase family 1 protein [Clostridiales bacterium]
MKILILTNFDMGLYKFRKELICELCRENQVIAALPDGEYIEALKDIGLKCINFEFKRRGTNPFADIYQFIRYIKLIKRVKPDIVLTYTIKPNVYGGLACRILKVPYIANVTGLGTSIENGGILSILNKKLYKIGISGAKCVFFQNRGNQKFFEEHKIANGNNRLIPGSGVNLSVHHIEEYPEDDGNIKFLFIGRIMKDKGIDELLEAMECLYERYKNISLDIVGDCEENYGGKLLKAASKGFIKYYGKQKFIHSFIKNAHCCVLPSYHEGLANVMLEAAATGRPVITTRIHGCCETFEEGVTGFGCEPKSAESLREAMEKFLILPYEEKRQMGMQGRKKMEQEFDRNFVIEAYIDEIKK